MPNSANVNARILSRIENAGTTLDIVYPATRPIATGIAPGPAPVSPLTGPATVQHVFSGDVTPGQSSITIKCLWHDLATTNELRDRVGQEAYEFKQLGWVRDATALARVMVSEAALDTTNPYAGTKLDAADHVVYKTRRFRVLQVSVMGSSVGSPVSYYVWLTGNQQ